MAAHCRSCGSLLPREHPNYPLPERIAALAPHLATLMDAASEFMAVSADDTAPGTPEEFISWLAVDVERMSGSYGRRQLHGDR